MAKQKLPGRDHQITRLRVVKANRNAILFLYQARSGTSKRNSEYETLPIEMLELTKGSAPSSI